MDKLIGILGLVVLLGIAFALSNNKKKINIRLVLTGLVMQIGLGILILKVSFIKDFFKVIGRIVEKVDHAAFKGAAFVYGNIAVGKADGSGSMLYREGENLSSLERPFVFGFNVMSTIIIICILVAIFYHFGLMQRLIGFLAKWMNKILQVSGVESLSNVASAFVGQVEAQVMIQPYIKKMTKSEIMASMAGSFACISGSVMAIYASFGIPMEFLLTASLMAAPGALVMAKIIYPETEIPETKGNVKLSTKSPYNSLIDAITHACSDGMKIAINVFAMVIGFTALMAIINTVLGYIPGVHLSLDSILGYVFYPLSWLMGVPKEDVFNIASMMGKKIALNEFFAYLDLKALMASGAISEKGKLIASFALCGFANFASIGIQIGGISALCPERRNDIAAISFKAMIAGTLASFVSATVAGILM